MEDNIKNRDSKLSKLGKLKLETIGKIESAINEILDITAVSYTHLTLPTKRIV